MDGAVRLYHPELLEFAFADWLHVWFGLIHLSIDAYVHLCFRLLRLRHFNHLSELWIVERLVGLLGGYMPFDSHPESIHIHFWNFFLWLH